MTTFDGGQSQDSRVIETAAGTTSSSNSDSGNLAYVIAGIAIGLSLLIGSGLSGCMSLVSTLVDEELGGGYDTSTDIYDYDFDDDIDYFDENYFPEDFLDHLDTEEQGEPTPDETMGSGSLEEILDSGLAMYDTTIDSLLPAMSYANASPDVRNYVRDIVLVDRDASSELHELLRSAAWGDAELDAALAQASEKASATAEELRNKELPTVAGGNAEEASRQLELGRTAAIDRWEAISSELEVLAGASEDGTVDATSLQDADAQVASAANDAALAFGEALSASASL